MRATHVTLIIVACLSLFTAGTAMGDTLQSTDKKIEASTGEACLENNGDSCGIPTASTRVTVTTPSVSVEDVEPSCDNPTEVDAEDAEDCQPSIDNPKVKAHAGVHGLDLDDEDDEEASTQGESATVGTNDGDGLFAGYSGGFLLAGALGVGASGMAVTVGLRRFATLLLTPLASRLKRSELLENDKRRAIYEKINEDPGINLRDLADELDLAWGTLLHHLRKLEDNHLVTSERYGKYRRFFQNGSTYSEEEQARLAALSTPSTARVAEYILENPGANQSEIGDAIGVTASTILFHVRRLKEVGLVEEEREGRYVHYYPKLEDHEAQQLAAA